MMEFTKEQLDTMVGTVSKLSCLADFFPGARIAPFEQILPTSVSAAFSALSQPPLSVQTATAPQPVPFSAEHEFLKLGNNAAFPQTQPIVQPLQNPFQSTIPNLLSPEKSAPGILKKSQAGQPLDNPFLSPPITEHLNLSTLTTPYIYPANLSGFMRLPNYSNASELSAFTASESSRVTNQDILNRSSSSRRGLYGDSMDVGSTAGCLSDMPLNLSTPSSLTEPELETIRNSSSGVRFANPEVSQIEECSSSSHFDINKVTMEINNFVQQSAEAVVRQLESQKQVKKASIYPPLEHLVAEALDSGPKTEMQIIEHIFTRPKNPQQSSADLRKEVSWILNKPTGAFIRDNWRKQMRGCEPCYYRYKNESDMYPNGITIATAVKIGGLPESILKKGHVDPRDLESAHLAFLEEHAAKISIFTGAVEFFNLKRAFENYTRPPTPPRQIVSAPAPAPPKAAAPKRGILKRDGLLHVKQRNVDSFEPETKKMHFQQLTLYAKHPNYGRYFCGYLFPENNFIIPRPREMAEIVSEHKKSLQ